ncbi:MAG: cation:proton antiporter [Candidatus Limnocylindrales bacterium]
MREGRRRVEEVTLTDVRWYIAAGLILVAMALVGSTLRRLPLSTSAVYLVVGVVLGPLGLAMLVVDPVGQAPVLEVISEVAVIVSLFTAGLKLRIPLRDRIWRLPIRLASLSMVLTVAAVALVGWLGLGLPAGAAVLLGAILAPTDPVLASDVQLSDAFDRDRVRFTLTGEAGLNDGTAFPFVMLGLGLLGLHEIGPFGLRWLAVDLVWAVAGGLAVGFVVGTGASRIVLHLRARSRAAVGLDELLLLGLIALSYGVAIALGTYGFLAVFAAGLAIRRAERLITGEEPPDELRNPAAAAVDEVADSAEGAAARVAHSLLTSNEAIERVAEVGLVIIVGAALGTVGLDPAIVWLGALLYLVIRPLSVVVGLAGTRTRRSMVALFGWFGIRGIGSVYYLSFAAVHGLAPDLAARLASITLGLVALSIVVHGVSVTPLMTWYEQRLSRRRSATSVRP